MLNFLIIDAQLEKIGTLKDGTISVNFHTQELTPEDFGQLFSMRSKLVYLAIKPELFNDKEKSIIGELEAEISDIGKTPSQRLRSVLYLNWKQNNEGFKDSNLHYLHYIEKIIEHYKNKL